MVVIVDVEKHTLTIPKEALAALLRVTIKELKKDNSSIKKKLMANRSLGLCWLITDLLNEILLSKWVIQDCGCCVTWGQLTIHQWLRGHFHTWVRFSGNYGLPIVVKGSKYSAQQQFRFCNKWRGKQLQARLDLLEHIAKNTDDLNFHVTFNKQEQPV